MCDVHSTTLDPRRCHNSNTWGFSRKIGEHTFGDYHYLESKDGWSEPTSPTSSVWNVGESKRQATRDLLRTYTKIFDIGGYIPGISIIAGLIRIIAAVIFRSKIKQGIAQKSIVGDFIGESTRTYRAQIGRGLLELIPILGQLINFGLDCYWYKQWGKGRVGNIN